MRVVIQRVKQASVTVDRQVVGKIGPGLLVLLGVKKDDTPAATTWLVNKLTDLRIFCDEAGKMNRCAKEIGGELLVVSQFTLYANCLGGRRPDFFDAAAPEFAEACYCKFIEEARGLWSKVETGRFGAKMDVALINDGPVTLVIDR